MTNKYKILVVDDESLVAADLSISLKQLGYEVTGTAASGEEALSALERDPVDLVLMDIVIQGELNGIETAQLVRDRYDIPVVYLTAHTDEHTVNQAKLTGPYGYLVKPFEAVELKTTIEMALYKHRSEKELRESEAWFSTTFRSIGDGVIVTDQAGVISFLNPYAAMLTGVTSEEAVDKVLDAVFSIIDERKQTPITGLVETTLGQGESIELIDTALLRSRDGREIPVDISVSPVKTPGGDINGVVLVFHDTLDRKLTEEALRESEERYRSIFEESRDAIYIVTQKGYFVVANQSLLNLFNYDREEIIEHHIAELFVDKEAWGLFSQAVENNEAVRDFPVLMRARNDVILECLITASVRKNKDGKIMGYQGIIRDMTERNRSERALRKSEQRYRMLAENIMDIIWTLDNEQRFTFVSPSVTALLGYSVDEILAMHLPDLCETADYQALLNRFAGVFSANTTEEQSEGGKSLELKLLKKGGEAIWVDLSFNLLKDEDQVNVGILGVVHDISRRIAAEAEKDRLHSQLLQAQKMEAIGLLAGGVAHDFNNLLTVIQGNTDLAMMNLDPSEMLYADLQEIHKAAQRAADLTSQLLLFSRKQPMRLVSLQLGQIVDDLLKMLHRLIGEDVEIITEIDDDVAAVQADRGNIEQVIMNLAVNARDAMPNGGTFMIRCKNKSLDDDDVLHMPEGRPGQFVKLSLIDQGMGMPKEVLERIFEPFFSTKGRGRGTGLGLSVVYGIIKQHSGWIHVTSEEGVGTGFHIYFPADLEMREVAEERLESSADIKGHNQYIMVIEDESGVRLLTTKALTENGYRVISAKSAVEAREVFENNKDELDAIVSDVVLPDGTGVELVNEFLEEKPGMPILLCSGYTDKKSQWDTIQERGYPFLQKPFNIMDLLKRVHAILPESEAGEEEKG